MNNKGVIGIVVLIAVLCGVMFAMQHGIMSGEDPNKPPRLAPVIPPQTLAQSWPILLHAAVSPTPFGNPKAPYTVLEIGDFQCPNCGQAEPMVMQAINQSRGKAKLYFYNFPLPSIHPHAIIAAEAGLAAAAQGKFWPMYSLLYAHQDELIDSQIEFNARSIQGLNTSQFASDLRTGKYLRVLGQELDTITNIPTIESVPTVLVRDPSGHISVFQGAAPTNPHPTYPGIIKMVTNPPWGGGSAYVAPTGTDPGQPGS
jgi:protein-disulfide isomerase